MSKKIRKSVCLDKEVVKKIKVESVEVEKSESEVINNILKEYFLNLK